MSKRAVVFCITGFIISMAVLKAQEVETIYFDTENNVVPVKEFADYYRIIEKSEHFPKMFRDYYMSGKIFRKGGKIIAVDANGDNLIDGNLTEYYENGDIHICCQYEDGKINGLYTRYEDGFRYERNYVNGVPTDEYYCVYDKDGNMSRVEDDLNTIYYLPLTEDDRFKIMSGGQLWQVYSDGSLTVAAQLSPMKAYGKYYRLDLMLGNGSLENIDFDPTEITARQNNMAGQSVSLKSISANDFMNKIDKKNRSRTSWYALTQNFGGQSYTASTTGNGTVVYSTHYSNADALYARQIASNNISSYSSRLADEMYALSDGYLENEEIFPGEHLSGYILFENNSANDVEVVIPIHCHDYVFHFSQLENTEFGSWDILKGCKEIGFSLAFSPMVTAFLDEDGYRSELLAYEASAINELNSQQNKKVFKRSRERYSIVLEIVSADQDDAELRGWAYLYDTASLEKLASYRIHVEGGKGSSFNLRLEKSLHLAISKLVSKLSLEGVIEYDLNGTIFHRPA